MDVEHLISPGGEEQSEEHGHHWEDLAHPRGTQPPTGLKFNMWGYWLCNETMIKLDFHPKT